MMNTLKVGDKVPNFSSIDESGNPIHLSDYAGKKLVVFFYPKASTPGCTVEACNLRDNYEELQSQGYELLGVSADSPRRQTNFKKKYNFPFPLLADEDHTVLNTFGVWGQKKFMGRTFDGIHRLRISSIEPNLLQNETIEFVSKSDTFVPHFHIPLQSGSDTILRLMRRKYKTQLYTERVAKIKSLMPDACIGVDVIVGFPQETDEEFLKTYQFLAELDIAYLHVFTYSERQNTRATSLKGVVPKKVRQERSERLRALSEKKKRYFYEQQLGKKAHVLWEHDVKNNRVQGYTQNYVRLVRDYQTELPNSIETVEMSAINDKGLVEIV
mgnify:CR=1 FL=1